MGIIGDVRLAATTLWRPACGEPWRRPMTTYSRTLVPLLVVLILFQSAVILFIDLRRPYWGDEAHFVSTARAFADGMSVETLRTYNEMSGPLPFALYGLWGRLFGIDIQVLRLLSVIIAIATYVLLHRLLFTVFRDPRTALLTTVFVVVQPYMIGFSVFVFTDMLAMAFLVLACLAVLRQKPVLLAVALACGLLCRQYLVFLVLAAGVYSLLRLAKERDRADLSMLLALGVSLLPMVALGLFWGGLSPDNQLRRLFLDERPAFHPSYLSLYVSQMFVYLFPLVVLFWRRLYLENPSLSLAGFLLACAYWLFPIAPPVYTLNAGIETVGFFHRAVRMIVGVQREQSVLFVACLLGMPVVLAVVRDAWTCWKRRDLDFLFFCSLAILSFLLVMPWSYLCWEKYFLPVVRLASMQLVARYRESSAPVSPSRRAG